MEMFKNAISKTSVQWLQETIKNRVEQVRKQFDETGQESVPFEIPGLSFDKNELNLELNKTLNQIKTLKTFGDVTGYIDTQKVGAMMANPGEDVSITKLQEFFKANLNFASGEQPSLAKILIKIQLGGIYGLMSETVASIRDLLKKIGRDTLISDVSFDDLTYLFNWYLKEDISYLDKYCDAHPEVKKEIGKEIKDLSNPKLSWKEKQTAKRIVLIYADKNRDEYLESSVDPSSLDVKNATSAISELLQLNNRIIAVSLEIDFATMLFEELNHEKQLSNN